MAPLQGIRYCPQMSTRSHHHGLEPCCSCRRCDWCNSCRDLQTRKWSQSNDWLVIQACSPVFTLSVCKHGKVTVQEKLLVRCCVMNTNTRWQHSQETTFSHNSRDHSGLKNTLDSSGDVISQVNSRRQHALDSKRAISDSGFKQGKHTLTIFSIYFTLVGSWFVNPWIPRS